MHNIKVEKLRQLEIEINLMIKTASNLFYNSNRKLCIIANNIGSCGTKTNLLNTLKQH